MPEANLVMLDQMGDRRNVLLVNSGRITVESVGSARQLGRIRHFSLMLYRLQQSVILLEPRLPRRSVWRGMIA